MDEEKMEVEKDKDSVVSGFPPSRFPDTLSQSLVPVLDPENGAVSCLFCKRTTVDELKLGPLYQLPEDGVVTHYFCMLFSGGLVQRGEDADGILGFLPADIRKEVRRSQKLKCFYCHLTGAGIGCNNPRCKTSFHFPCGVENDANFQFTNNYQTFCKMHATHQSMELPSGNSECPICFAPVTPPERPIVGPCCKNTLFHKDCLQICALNAGYYFKCPTCNTDNNFANSAKEQGIFVPEQDAAWEREQGRYRDFYKKYKRCDAEVCLCPEGRRHRGDEGPFLLARCRSCGSAGTHKACGKLTSVSDWACASCLKVERRTEKKKRAVKKLKGDRAQNKLKRGEETVPTPGSSRPPNKDEKKKEDKSFDLATIKIAPSSRDYFPHSKAAKRKFAETQDFFPDWRQYELRVHLVNLFGDALEPGEPEPFSKKLCQMIQPGSSSKQDSSSKNNSKNAKVYKARKRKRGGPWKDGTSGTSKSNGTTGVSSESNFAIEKETVVSSSTKSSAVLLGIQRSHLSLLQLQALKKTGNDPIRILGTGVTGSTMDTEVEDLIQEEASSEIRKEGTSDDDMNGNEVNFPPDTASIEQSIKQLQLEVPPDAPEIPGSSLSLQDRNPNKGNTQMKMIQEMCPRLFKKSS